MEKQIKWHLTLPVFDFSFMENLRLSKIKVKRPALLNIFSMFSMFSMFSISLP